jgi:hypothetical protein
MNPVVSLRASAVSTQDQAEFEIAGSSGQNSAQSFQDREDQDRHGKIK